jgi:hypothetical protein
VSTLPRAAAYLALTAAMVGAAWAFGRIVFDIAAGRG